MLVSKGCKSLARRGVKDVCAARSPSELGRRAPPKKSRALRAPIPAERWASDLADWPLEPQAKALSLQVASWKKRAVEGSLGGRDLSKTDKSSLQITSDPEFRVSRLSAREKVLIAPPLQPSKSANQHSLRGYDAQVALASRSVPEKKKITLNAATRHVPRNGRNGNSHREIAF